MKRPILTATLLLSLSVLPAFAGSPPETGRQTPSAVTASCAALGAAGETLANGAGCRNTETGAAVICTDGQCTDYFADPRYKKIRIFLDANKAKPQKSL